MCKWYHENLFSKLDCDEPLTSELEKTLGGFDGTTSFNNNNSAIFYFLLKNNVIESKEPFSDF